MIGAPKIRIEPTFNFGAIQVQTEFVFEHLPKWTPQGN